MKKPGILLTRDGEANERDSQLIDQRAYTVYSIPLIETNSLGINLSNEWLQPFDWLFFTSSNAVRYFCEAVADKGVLTTKKIAVIGEQTAETVRQYGLPVTFIPSQYTSPVIIAEWFNKYGADQSQEILLPKSNLARSNIQAALLAKGCRLTERVLYQNKLPANSRKELLEVLASEKIALATFSCPSAWRRFMEVAHSSDIAEIRFGAIGRITQEAIRQSGQQALIPDRDYTMAQLLATLTTN